MVAHDGASASVLVGTCGLSAALPGGKVFSLLRKVLSLFSGKVFSHLEWQSDFPSEGEGVFTLRGKVFSHWNGKVLSLLGGKVQ